MQRKRYHLSTTLLLLSINISYISYTESGKTGIGGKSRSEMALVLAAEGA